MVLVTKELIFLALLPSIIPAISNMHAFPPPPDEITLQIKPPHDPLLIVNLVRVSSTLANKNLPLMITSKKQNPKYIELKKKVMNNIGDFAMYHDYTTNSAVVYFRKKGILNGIVGLNFHVKRLSIKDINEVQKIKNSSQLDIWKYLCIKKLVKKLHHFNHIESSEDNTIENDQRPHVYPELLVAISNDMFKAFRKNYVKIVSHVLTVYNAVDMMFRLMQSTKISLNIATIVIESIRSWSFIPRYISNKILKVDSEKVNDKISLYFKSEEEYFPRDSYDYIAYNTRLAIWDSSSEILIHGIALSPSFKSLYPFDTNNYYDRLNLAVIDYSDYKSYFVIAQELAYILNAKSDEEVPQFIEPQECKYPNLMGESSHLYFPLKWNEQAEKEIAEFCRSSLSCNLINYPNSLSPFPRKPKIVLSSEKQCQCYGFKSFLEVKDNSQENICTKSIQCTYKNNCVQGDYLPLPADGTPCGPNRVCWLKSCVPSQVN